MAEPSSTPTPNPAANPAVLPAVPPAPARAEQIEYRPLSPWALTGFILSLLFALTILASFLFAIYSGAPFYLPGWVVLFALLAAGVSYVADRQLAFAEGTRAGRGLARWGIWLGVFSGLGYIAFSYVTELALTNQATAFLMTKDDAGDRGFFPRLLSGDRAELNRAFLLTLRAEERGKPNPADEKEMSVLFDVGTAESRGRLGQFREHWLVKELRHSDPNKVDIRPLGIQKWDFEKAGYRIVRNFRITTPEKIIEVSLPIQSSEATQEGELRKWYLPLFAVTDANKQQTELGKTLESLRRGIYPKLFTWIRERPSGPRAEDITAWETIVPSPELRKHLQEMVKLIVAGQPVGNLLAAPPGSDALPWKQIEGGKLLLSYPVHLIAPKSADYAGYTLDGFVRYQSTGPVDLQDPGTPTWELKTLEWTRYAPILDPLQKGGPKGGGMPSLSH